MKRHSRNPGRVSDAPRDFTDKLIEQIVGIEIAGSPYKSMQVDFYQRVNGIGITNKTRQVNAA